MTADEALAHLKGAVQRGDWTPRTNAEAFEAIESRLVALQRVADAATALTDANREKLRHGRASRQEVQLEGALRALESSDG